MIRSLIASALAIAIALPALANEVNVYSYRQTFLMEPLFKAFEQETGIKVNFIFSKKGLLERAEAEGSLSPVDVFLTSDFGLLIDAKERDLVQAVQNDTIDANLPAQYRDPEGYWFGLTERARIIYAAKGYVKPGSVTRYEDLAKPDLGYSVCTRSGTHNYNIALIASVIAANGEEEAEAWLEGLKANLARKPSGNDRAQVKGIWAGECDLAVGNTYYMGKMLNNKEQIAWAESVDLIFPNQEDRGTHVNISGMAMAKYAPNPEAAIAFMTFLTSEAAQSIYASENYEYPVNPAVEPSELLKSWGEFKADNLSLADVAAQRAAASGLVEKTRFNN